MTIHSFRNHSFTPTIGGRCLIWNLIDGRSAGGKQRPREDVGDSCRVEGAMEKKPGYVCASPDLSHVIIVGSEQGSIDRGENVIVGERFTEDLKVEF